MGRRTIFAGGSIEWDDGAIRVLLSGPGGETSTEIQRRARAVQRRAQYAAPVKTGGLRSSIHVNTRFPSEGAVADITAEAPNALYVEFGRKAIDLTGTRRYMHWIENGHFIFTQRVAAVAPTHFMLNALDEAGGFA